MISNLSKYSDVEVALMTASAWNAPSLLSMGPFGLHCLSAAHPLAGAENRKKKEGGKKETVGALLT